MSSFTRLWRTDPVLVGTGLFLAALTVPFGLGLLLDPRIITGAPAWLKPLKFAVSTAIYAFTLAWVFTFLPDWPRLRRIVGAGTAAAFVLEVAMIGGQAWRGTTSHFNVATPFDAAVFAVMGLVIVAADAARRRAGGGALAAAVRRSRAGLGAAPRPRRHRARRVHRRADDAADGGADRGGPGDAPDADLGRPHRRRARWRAGAAR